MLHDVVDSKNLSENNVLINNKSDVNMIIKKAKEYDQIEKINNLLLSNQLSTIDISSKNLDDTSIILLEVDNCQISFLQKYAAKEYNDIKYANGIIRNSIFAKTRELKEQQHATSLLFDGHSPKKIDVLEKLLKIASWFESLPAFPYIPRNHVDIGIKESLGMLDPRTKKKYRDCVIGWIERTHGVKIRYDSKISLVGFKDAVIRKIDDLRTK